MIKSRDKHYYAITIASGTSIKFGATTVSLTAGTYWAHNDSSINSNYPSFYIMLKARLAATFASTSWEVYPIQPSGYTLRSGIRLKQLTGTSPGSLDLSATTGIVKRLLGFSEADVTTQAWSDRQIDGNQAAYGSWSPWSLFEGRADLKDSALQRVVGWSSDHPEVATSIVWRERNYRVLRYPFVYGCYVNHTRANYEDLAQPAGMSTGDFNNALSTMWITAGRNLNDIIVAYDMEVLDLMVTSHEYEFVRFADVKNTQDMNNLAKSNDIANDLWTVTIPYVILGGGGYGL